MAFGIVRFRLGARSSVHIVHRRRWLRIWINVQRFDMHWFVRVWMMTRWPVVSWRSMSGVAGMARRRSQHADTAGSGMGMRSQCIHVTGFTTDLQLVLDEGIVRSRWVRRRMMRCTGERRTAGWATAARGGSSSGTAGTLATTAVVRSSRARRFPGTG